MTDPPANDEHEHEHEPEPEHEPEHEHEHAEDERPPILGRWPVLYAVVVGALAVQAVLYYLLTRAYSP